MTEREITERALVGCVLEDSDLIDDVKPEWFDDLRLAQLVITVSVLLSEGKPVDVSTVAHASKDPECLVLLKECQEQCVSALNFSYWREIIVEISEKERLGKAADQFKSRLPSANGDLPTIIATLENALAKQASDGPRTLTNKDCAHKLTDYLEARMNLNGELSGIATGFTDLDTKLDGLQSGDVVILASRPSIGKTAIACNMVERICLRDKIPTLFLSLEMSATALTRRILSSCSGITMNQLKSGKFDQGDFAKAASFNTLLTQSPLFIREGFGGMGASQAAALIRRGVKRKQVKFVVLDYLQKLTADRKHEKRTYEVAEASGVITAAVKETGVAFICLAQLNRESEKDKGRPPRLSDLADSGQIERDADTVLLLHRDKADSTKPAQLIIAKQRDGETGFVKLNFDGAHCRFSTATRENQKEE